MVKIDDLDVRIEKIIADYLEISTDRVNAETTLSELDLDSLATIEVIMTIEKEVGISVPDEAFVSIETIQDLVVAFDKCQQKTPVDTDYGSFQ